MDIIELTTLNTDIIELTTSNTDVIELTTADENVIELTTSNDIIELNVTETTVLIVSPELQGTPVPGMYSDYGPPPENMNVANKSLYLDLDTYTLYKLGV